MIFGPIVLVTWLRLRCGFVVPLLVLNTLFFTLAAPLYAQEKEVPGLALPGASKEGLQVNYANADPYLNEPTEELIKRIPELEGLKPRRIRNCWRRFCGARARKWTHRWRRWWI